MEVIYRIPTEMYGYVEIKTNGGALTKPEDIKEDYEYFVQAFKPKPVNSISDKDFNQFIDNMLLGTNGNHVEVYNAMSPVQQQQVQCVKKALARIKAKQSK